MSGQRRHESPDVGAMVARMFRALVKRAGEGDLEAIEQLCILQDQLADAVRSAGRALHDGPAQYSWTEIARSMGTTRQNARQRCA